LKIKPVLIICALVVMVFGLGYIFIPAQMLSLIGYETDSIGLLILQFVGILSMGYVASIWAVRDAGKEIQHPTILSAFVAMGFAFIVALIHQLSGTFGGLGWFGVLNFGLAFFVFGYFWIFKVHLN